MSTRVNSLANRLRLRSRASLQAFGFVASTAAVSLGTMAFSAIVARHLSIDEFGSFSFAVSFLMFVALIFDFGFFTPAGRLLAALEGREQRELIAAGIVVFIPIGLAFSATVFGLSFVVDSIFNVHAATALRWSCLVAVGVPFTNASLQIVQGTSRLHVYSITAVIAQVASIVALIAVELSSAQLSVTNSLLVRLGGIALAGVLVVVALRPVFRKVRANVAKLRHESRRWGFQVYVGRLLSIATYNMDVLMVAALANARDVALYTLAGAIARAVGLPVIGMSSALFPTMTREDRINRRWLTIAWTISLVGFAGCVAVGKPFIDLVFGSRFEDAFPLLIPLALAEALRGVTTLYNMFLGAQARGKELRNSALVLTGSNLALNVALIPPFGAMGAAIASLIALLLNLMAHAYYYRRWISGEAPASV